MKIYHDATADVARYIDRNRDVTLEDKKPRYETYLRTVRNYTRIGPESEILEIGTGTGWFPLLCKLNGLRCKGLEISPQLIEVARATGERYGVEPDIELGNLEDYPLPDNFYDVVIASSVFEHVEDWRTGIRKVYRTLKPGGVMFFESTNKFSFVSGEYNAIPLYGWMPNSWRYTIRRKIHGDDIMKLGIDFHQFTHGCLRKEFVRVGFTRIFDRVDVAREEYVSSGIRRMAVQFAKRLRPVRLATLTFAEATRFICVK
jgi:2-polyprenyl-3-methyl-5-hydroxy-6-metoxy-1,4-benzoquinol methylase